MKQVIEIRDTASAEDLAVIRELFLEYGHSLGFHICFESFGKEMAGLPGAYAGPEGALLLATADGQAAGCVAMRRIDQDTAEMKRLYVRPGFRGTGLGRRLAEAVLARAREAGYLRVRLDTLPEEMAAAVALYRSLGFREIPRYSPDNPDGSVCMEAAVINRRAG